MAVSREMLHELVDGVESRDIGVLYQVMLRFLPQKSANPNSYTCEYGYFHDYDKLDISEVLEEIEEMKRNPSMRKSYANARELFEELDLDEI